MVLGQSWGTTIGVLGVQQRPELYQAFIGTGQMVSQLATDRIVYDDTRAWAQKTGRDGFVAQLEASGPPPYETILSYEPVLAQEQQVSPDDHSGKAEGAAQMSENLLVPEYSLIDPVHILGAFLDTFAALYPQLQDIDFRQTATDFQVPMFFVQGAHEADGRARLFDEWYPRIDAPFAASRRRPIGAARPEWSAQLAHTVRVRHTEFWARMDTHLGPGYAQSWALDQHLARLDGRTASQALDAGVPPRQVWHAVWEALELPASER